MKFTVTVTPVDEPFELPDFNETWKQAAFRLANEKEESKEAPQEDTATESPPATPRTVGEALAEAEAKEAAGAATQTIWYGTLVHLFDLDQVEDAYKAKCAGVGATDRGRLSAAIAALREKGNHRHLATIPAEWHDRLNELEKLFPNFTAVVDYLRSSFALAAYSNDVPELAPMLLNGPPGVGKTLFASQFTKLFGSDFVKLGMETAQSSAAVVGSAEYWGNTKPGIVYETLVHGEYANPVFFLDEVDKARDDHNDPLMSLYALFERHTARHFRDESFPWVELDASHVMWICTSNNVDDLPEPILSRLRRFDIPAPDEKQARRIAQQIFKDVLNSLPPYLRNMRLQRSTLDLLCDMSPRLIQMSVREAIGRAVYHERTTVLPRDLPLIEETVEEPRKMGFLP